MKKIRILVVGLGTMGISHARAYKSIAGFDIVGLCSRGVASRDDIESEFPGVARFSDYAEALRISQPDAVSINTWPDTHADYAQMALHADAHVFVEKPIADTVAKAEALAALAKAKNKKLVIGYIFRVHPSWIKFIEVGKTLGKPLVMRMNLNQQSSGPQWQAHKQLMKSLSPIVDCGVHYVDVMCQVTGAKPVRVHALGAKLSHEIAGTMYNYGHLHVSFDDGSVGWYEAGWGPMMSETAYFVKDMIGPHGSVSIAMDERSAGSADIDGHTRTSVLRLHHAKLNAEGKFEKPDEMLRLDDEPGHQDLCNREQDMLLDAILNDRNLDEHVDDAVNSLRIVLAADESVRTGEVVKL